MAAKTIPQVINNFNLYVGDLGDKLIGTGEVTLPSIVQTTNEINLAGMAGAVDLPIVGQIQSMQTVINVPTMTPQQLRMAIPKAQLITARAAIQVYDVAAGVHRIQQATIIQRCTPKELALGSLQKANAQGTGSTFEVDYLKIMLDGVTYIEIDKFAGVYIVDGVDYLAEVNAAI